MGVIETPVTEQEAVRLYPELAELVMIRQAGWQFAHQDGSPGEVWAKFGKEGSTLGGLAEMVSILLSLCLQYGVPPQVIIEKFLHMRFEPFGMTDDPDIAEVSSLADYLARRLALDFLTSEARTALGITAMDDEANNLAAHTTHPSKTLSEGMIR